MTLIVILALGGILSSAVGRHCPSPPPGINKMRRGVDVTTLDVLPADLSSSGHDGFRKPIVDFTCNNNRKWTNRRQNTYDLPDQIWDILNVPAGWTNANVKIFKSSKEVKKSMAVRVGLDLNFNFGMFSASGSYKKMQHTLSQTSSYIEEVSTYDSALKVDLAPAFIMGAGGHFKQMLNRLPADFSVNPSQYLDFVKYFGTHYFTSGNFGGTIKLNIETQSSYYKGKSDREIQAQAKASFFNMVKISASGSSSTSRVDENFRRSSTQSLRYYGGDTNLLKQDLLTWQPTVINNPWLFSGELAPITDFIDDPKKKDAVKRAIKAYLNKAYLREMHSLLTTSSTFSGAADLLKRVKAELEKVEPSQSEVDQLGQKVREDFLVPAWFSADLQLCYNWYADIDGGQCGGGAAHTLCAEPGHMTPKYRDDTDGRPGGCRMRWGLIPKRKTQPLWFQNVQICYRWYADGDAGQCQSARGSYCAPLNKYTSYYRDDTDGRPGGCQMSWKLEIPSSSPQWLKNAKLCYSWYPDGDGGQCGGGAHRDLCATANTWTGYYRDDTDGRPGGCPMMWGIKLD